MTLAASSAEARVRIVVVGAGGLGGPLALAMANGPSTSLALVDHDTVDLSNLQRQIQFRTTDIGRAKVSALAETLCRRGIDRERLEVHDEPLTPASADRLLGGATVVIEGTDDPNTKFLVNDWCGRNGTPFVIAAVGRYGGNVFAGNPPTGGCYRCLFETPPTEDEAPSCADTGVLGATVGFIAGVAARSAQALLANPREQRGQLVVFDDLRRSTTPRILNVASRPGCTTCCDAATRGEL